MKLRVMTALGALAAMAFAGNVFAAQSDADQAKQSAQQTWKDTKDTASHGWDATKQGTKDAWNDTKAKARSLEAHRLHTLRGTVTRIHGDSLAIRDAHGKTVALKRDDDTKVSSLSGGTAQLEEGSQVRAAYQLDKNGKRLAKSLILEAAPSHTSDATAPSQDRDKDHDDDAK